MHGDFRPLVNPATWSDEIDIEGTRTYRERVHEAIRVQQLAFPFADLPIPADPAVLSAGTWLKHFLRCSTPNDTEVARLLVGVQLRLHLFKTETLSRG